MISVSEGGKRAVLENKRDVQGGKKMNGKQAAEVLQLIEDAFPEQLERSFGLWIREVVPHSVQDRVGFSLSRWHAGRLAFTELGIITSKPFRKAFEQNPELVFHSIKQKYPAIKRRAAAENAMLYFVDKTACFSLIPDKVVAIKAAPTDKMNINTRKSFPLQ